MAKNELPQPPVGARKIGIEVWKPQAEDEVLEGKLTGQVELDGSNGKYRQFHVTTKDNQIMAVSGANIEQCLLHCEYGKSVWICFTGMQSTGQNRKMKSFDVYVIED